MSQPYRWRRSLFLGVSALLAASLVAVAHEVMLPFVLAILIAYVLTPLVAAVERRRLPRPAAVLIVYAAVLGSIAAFVHAVTPRITLEFRNLRGELPALAEQARDQWVPAITARLRAAGLTPEPAAPAEAAEPAFVIKPEGDGTLAVDVGSGVSIRDTKRGFVVESTRERKGEPFDPNRLVAEAVGKTFAYAQQNSLEIARAVRDLIASVSRVLFIFFITLMMAAYIVITRERIIQFFRSLVHPSGRASFDSLLDRVDEGLSGVVRGQLLICAVNGILSAAGFAFVRLKYWPVMAIVASVFSLVPIFGSIASAVPAVGVALTQGLGTATFVLLWILGIHQLEANVLNPKIMGDAAKIHPVLIIFALLVGQHLFHTAGALLAVPTMSIVQSVFLHFRAAIDAKEG